MSALQLCRLKAPQLPANSYSFMAVRVAPSFAGILQTLNLDASKLCRDWKAGGLSDVNPFLKSKAP